MKGRFEASEISCEVPTLKRVFTELLCHASLGRFGCSGTCDKVKGGILHDYYSRQLFPVRRVIYETGWVDIYLECGGMQCVRDPGEGIYI